MTERRILDFLKVVLGLIAAVFLLMGTYDDVVIALIFIAVASWISQCQLIHERKSHD